MIPLFLVSNSPYTGKTFLTLGLGLNLKEMGYKIGYISLIGKYPIKKGKNFYDEEALFVRDLLELEDSLDVVSPFVYTYETQHHLFEGKTLNIKEKILNSLDYLKDRDFVFIVCGDSVFEGYLIDIYPVKLVKEVGGKVLALQIWKGETSLDDLFGIKSLFEKEFLGGILNKVPLDYFFYVKEKVISFANSKNLKIFGVFKREKELEAVTIKQILEVINGGVICGEDKLNEFVENFSIGAMDVENAFKHFLRIPNKAVITGVHRTDIQIAALETSTKCLILTGGSVVSDSIIAKAKEKGVPIIITFLDTFTVVDKIENLMGKAMIREKSKALKAKEIVKEEFDIEGLLRSVGK